MNRQPLTAQSAGEFQFPPYLTPIKFDAFTPESLRELIGGRRLYLRGAAFVGQGAARALSRLDIPVAGFIDRSPRLRGRRLAGFSVFSPEDILAGQADLSEKIFVVITSGFYEDELRAELTGLGLAEGRDFIAYSDLNPLCPSVDVAGICNLRCRGCPRGNMPVHPPAGFMSAAVYAQVADKLLRELPFLGEVQLYTWGEPLLNRELPEIIAHNQARRLLSIISTNLNVKAEAVEALAKAGPEIVRVSCSGWGADYEATHTGGNWDLFLKNTRRLAELNRELKAGMELEFFYHLYRHNGGAEYEKIKRMAEDLGYVFRTTMAFILPRENVIALRRGLPLSAAADKHMASLLPEADRLLRDKDGWGDDYACSANRCFSINWNLSVRVCGATYLPTTADNFMEVPLSALARRTAESEICALCAQTRAHSLIKDFMADQRLVKGD